MFLKDSSQAHRVMKHSFENSFKMLKQQRLYLLCVAFSEVGFQNMCISIAFPAFEYFS